MIPGAGFARARAQLAALCQVENPLELQLRTAAESREWYVAMLSLHRDLDMAYLQRHAAEEGVADGWRPRATQTRAGGPASGENPTAWVR